MNKRIVVSWIWAWVIGVFSGCVLGYSSAESSIIALISFMIIELPENQSKSDKTKSRFKSKKK